MPIYPSILKHHLRLKNMCSKRANDQASWVSDQISQTSDRVSDRVSEKNTVPVQLSLV